MKTNWRGLIGLLISAALIWWLIAGSGIDWGSAWGHVRQANIWLLVLSSAASTLIFAIRAPRWRHILGDDARDIPFSSLWEPIVIGQAATNLIPLRAGEVARTYALVKREPRIPFSTALASIVVDRVFDGIVVLLLLSVAVLDPAFPSESQLGGKVAVPVAALAGALMVLFAIVFHPARLIGAYRAAVRRAYPRMEEPGAELLGRFAAGLGVLRSPRRASLVFFWTVLHWLVCALSFWFAYEALGIDVPLTTALFVQAVIVIFVALPSTPGFVGPFETGALFGLAVYGVDRDLAIAWAIVYHAISYLPVTALGAFYALRMGLRPSEIRSGIPDGRATAP